MTIRMRRLAQEPGDVSKALQDAVGKAKSSQDPAPVEPETAEPPSEAAPADAPPDLGMEPMGEGADSPMPVTPELPTLPALGGGGEDPFGMGPAGTTQAPEQDQAQKLTEATEGLVSAMEQFKDFVTQVTGDGITTALIPKGSNIPAAEGRVSLENIPSEDRGAPEEVPTKQEESELGLHLTPFSTHARRSSMKVNRRDPAPPATQKRVVRAEQLEPTDGPPMAVPGAEEASKPVDGEKAFVEEPKQEKGNFEQGDPGNVAPLFPTASQLRASRRSRLGYAPDEAPTPASDVSQEERESLVVAAERKASDLAGLYLTRYQSAIELAHRAQEKGIIASPLRDKLAVRLAQAGVPDAEVLAAEVVEGTATDSFYVAHNQALEYLDMDDETFLRVAETIHKTPGGTRTARSDRERLAQDVRTSAIQGSLPVQASGPLAPMDGLRERLRRTTPRPVGIPYNR